MVYAFDQTGTSDLGNISTWNLSTWDTTFDYYENTSTPEGILNSYKNSIPLFQDFLDCISGLYSDAGTAMKQWFNYTYVKSQNGSVTFTDDDMISEEDFINMYFTPVIRESGTYEKDDGTRDIISHTGKEIVERSFETKTEEEAEVMLL